MANTIGCQWPFWCQRGKIRWEVADPTVNFDSSFIALIILLLLDRALGR